jgi:HNH endonuclease/NUMOD4 motif
MANEKNPVSVEVWKQFRATQYSVSTYGRVRNDRTGQLLNPTIDRRKGGQPTCRKVRFGPRADLRTYRVGSMVLETFRGKRPAGKEGCHRNGDPTDDRLSNLYWGTHTQNMRDAVRHGRLGDTTAKGHEHPNAKLSVGDVERARDLRSQGVSVRKIRDWLGLRLSAATLWKALHGGRYAT